jgi:hypothetical protein
MDLSFAAFITFLTDNWQWLLLGLFVAEKVVKFTPWEQDDVVFDFLVIPIFNKIKELGGLKVFLPFLLVLAFAVPSYAETRSYAPVVTWNRLDESGAKELSYPVTLKVYNFNTNELVSQQAITDGASTEFTLPGFAVDVPDNTEVELVLYATATDSAGNVSKNSVEVKKLLYGKDTIPPGAPSLIDIILAFFMRIFRFFV